MTMVSRDSVPAFDRRFFDGDAAVSRIGEGELGGKAASLVLMARDILGRFDGAACPGIRVDVPRLVVLTTDVFRAFVSENGLADAVYGDATDDRIAHACQRAELPAQFVGDLRALVEGVHSPLAVRSSSLLEDALAHPFAGVYATKMIPNNQHDPDTRFRKLAEAVKFVIASTFFRQPRDYMRSIDRDPREEAMAVVVQEIVGLRHGDLFYPSLSGVGRSYSYYPIGRARPEDGVVNLALGLGKAIVDGGLTWSYSPARPRVGPPFNGLGDMVKNTQTSFWGVNMGTPPPPDPVRETEFLVQSDLARAESDGALDHLVSTFDPASDRLRCGLLSGGARVLDFSPILDAGVLPLNEAVKQLLRLAKEALGADVEIEFALTFGQGGEPARLGLLQARPMQVAVGEVTVGQDELDGPGVLLASEIVLGHGARADLQDVVYVKPAVFEARHTPRIAAELERINVALQAERRPYLLIGFGRWGSSDPWLGVPVDWSQISQARVLVEATLPDMSPDLSQGSHFFHNLISFGVQYLSVPHTGGRAVDWAWLDALPPVHEGDLVRHVRTPRPLDVRVDGRARRGVIRHD